MRDSTQIIELNRSGTTPSRVVIGDVIGRLGDFLPQKKVIVITDANVHRHYTDIIDGFEHIIIGMGETNKTLVTMDKIYRDLLALKADRECFILGFGGGIVTDIAGFAASTYMRGLSFGFIATTLLAQVDASVGGKNGVNVDGYKNMIGTFNQPDFVLCDASVLKTLPEREFKAGLAEIIKAGVIADPILFSLFEKHTLKEFREDRRLLTEAITRAVKVKASIVERDERETGERRKLNLGHTFAHAIEKTSGDFLHGEAVSVGLAMIVALSVEMGELPATEASRIYSALNRSDLPTDTGIDSKRLLKALRLDKKRDSEDINIVLPTSVGSCEIRKISFTQLDGMF